MYVKRGIVIKQPTMVDRPQNETKLSRSPSDAVSEPENPFLA